MTMTSNDQNCVTLDFPTIFRRAIAGDRSAVIPGFMEVDVEGSQVEVRLVLCRIDLKFDSNKLVQLHACRCDDLPLRYLTTLLHFNSTSLKSLTFSDFNWIRMDEYSDGEDEDDVHEESSMGDALATLTELETFHLVNSGEYFSNLAKSFLRGLATCPKLQDVYLDPLEDSDFEGIEDLTFSATGLQKIKLGDVCTGLWDLSGVERITKCFALQTTLQCLEIQLSDISGDSASEVVATILRGNAANLEVLKLCMGYRFAEIVPNGKFLKALEAMRSLKCLHIHGQVEGYNSVQTKLSDAVLQMAKHNYVLNDVVLLAHIHLLLAWNWGVPAQFYVELNRFRGRLFDPSKQATQEDWVEAIIAFKDDTRAIFEFLSENPSLLWEKAAVVEQQGPSDHA
jgi:hypothetical protein